MRKRDIVKSLPFGKYIWLVLCLAKDIFNSAKLNPSEEDVGFFGWKMYTPHCPPWVGESSVSKNFSVAHNEFLDLFVSNKFVLSQFPGQEDKEYFLNSYRWRFYHIFWSVNYAINSTRSSQKNFVECGVCDGISTYFAIASSIAEKCQNQKFYLYDAWDEMEGKYLSDSEMAMLGEFSYLNIESTKSNLKNYEDITIFNKGALPDSFKSSENPDELVWLHIDLNAAQPTLAVLEYFYDKLVPGGVILLDDYGWDNHRPTKKIADKFFETKSGVNFPLPTGQSVFFKTG